MVLLLLVQVSMRVIRSNHTALNNEQTHTVYKSLNITNVKLLKRVNEIKVDFRMTQFDVSQY